MSEREPMDRTAVPTCLLNLVAARQLEAVITDWLLDDKIGAGFTCSHGYGHGTDPSRMSLAEQIAGRERRVTFQILCNDVAVAEALLARLTEAFPRLQAHYWITPVLAAGRLGESRDA